VYIISAHAGRMAWDEWLLIGVFAVPLVIAVVYFAVRLARGSR
jgi:hypothetical protein